MIMKNRLLILSMLTMFSLASFAKGNVTVKDTSTYKNSSAVMTVEQKKARLAEIHLQIAEIRSMDKSKLSKAERSELRTELKTLRKEYRAIDSSMTGASIVWLVFGAFIIGFIIYEVAKSG